MIRFFLVLSLGLFSLCCSDDPGFVYVCDTVTCAEGLTCGASDGLCYCGSTVCGEEETCVDSMCMRPLCSEVTCGGDSACSEDDGLCYCGAAPCRNDQRCEAGTCITELPEAICPTGEYAAGTPAFREVTDAWGLRGVEGVRLAVVDIDNDGLADLMVRRGGQAVDSFAADGTRRTWLLRNEGGRFVDVTEGSGILQLRGPGPVTAGRPVEIVAFADVDNDGDQDAYLAVNTFDEEVTGGQRSEILINQGDGTYVLGPESDVNSPDRVDAPAGASFIDFDLDGNIDLLVPHHNLTTATGLFFMQDRLYRGDGTGAFTEVTEAVGMNTLDWRSLDDLDNGLAHTRAWGALARDLTGDGFAELMIPSYGRSPNHLWRNSGGTTFLNQSVSSGYAYDQNFMWQDNQFAACYCISNPTAEQCDEVSITPSIGCSPNWSHETDRHPFRLGGNSGATSAADVDNDGDLDLLTGEIKHWWAGAGADGGELLVNNGDGVFTRPGDDVTGLLVNHTTASWDEGHMTNAMFDFDNDGRIDVYIGGSDYAGNRGRLYRQTGLLTFEEMAISDFFEHNRSHGVVVADFDRDGDLDVIVGHSRARCGGETDCYETSQVRAFENITPPASFVQLEIGAAAGANAAAIGAQARVQIGEGVQVQEVDGGHGHYGSQSDRVLHFGLGGACEAQVEVRFPNTAHETVNFTLPAGHRYRLTPDGIQVLE